ncbi:hypothetical protein EFS60_08850 [Leuconostoc lactis]|nr:hypothetical protein [Leuconostoc lactis]
MFSKFFVLVSFVVKLAQSLIYQGFSRTKNKFVKFKIIFLGKQLLTLSRVEQLFVKTYIVLV